MQVFNPGEDQISTSIRLPDKSNRRLRIIISFANEISSSNFYLTMTFQKNTRDYRIWDRTDDVMMTSAVSKMQHVRKSRLKISETQIELDLLVFLLFEANIFAPTCFAAKFDYP